MNLPWIIEAIKHNNVVKEVPGPRHNLVILNWLKNLKAWWNEDETPWCFSGETEILTEDGWIRLDVLTDKQKVYQADIDGKLTLTDIVRKIEKDYDDDVFVINHRNIRLTCDIGHRWWGYFGRDKLNKCFGTLDEINSDGLFVPTVSSSCNDVGFTMEQLWFLAAFISDGKLRYSASENNVDKKVPLSVEFEVSKSRKIEALTSLKPDHVYTQQKAYGPLTKTPLTVFRFKYPDYFNSCLDGYKSLSKNFINSLSKNDARVFLQAYTMFDGNGSLFDNTILYTSDEKLLKDLITIATLAGYHLSIQINKGISDLTRKTSYRIVFSSEKEYRHITKKHISRIPFKGKLYCVEVPQGRIVVRGPDSSPVVTGNCGVFTAHCMRIAGLTIPKTWMRAKDWSNGWGVKLAQPIYGCVVVFERQGGGHVGFVIGQTKEGLLAVLGGNQANAVNVAKFPKDRVVGYYWPRDYALPANGLFAPLQIVTVAGDVSVNEA